MTVSTTDSQIDYSSGGPSFPIPFKFLRDEDIRPVLTLADGSQVTLVQNVQYALTGAGNENGGTLTSAYAQTALATAGTLLRISRVMAPTQETDLRNQGRYFAETHESAFDKLTMLVQQSLTGVANALSLNSLKNRWDFRGLRGVNAGNPIDPQDVTTKSYVDSSNAAQDTRIDSLSAGLPGTNYAFPWSTTTTTGTKTLTPGFEFSSAVLYINGIAQTYGKAFAVAGNQIILAEAIPAGSEVYAILGQNVVPTAGLPSGMVAFSQDEVYPPATVGFRFKRTLHSKDAPFRCAADGITDDSDGLVALFAMSRALGGRCEIVIDDGIHACQKLLQCTSNTTVRFVGSLKCIGNPAVGTDTLLLPVNGASNVTYLNPKVDCNNIPAVNGVICRTGHSGFLCIGGDVRNCAHDKAGTRGGRAYIVESLQTSLNNRAPQLIACKATNCYNALGLQGGSGTATTPILGGRSLVLIDGLSADNCDAAVALFGVPAAGSTFTFPYAAEVMHVVISNLVTRNCGKNSQYALQDGVILGDRACNITIQGFSGFNTSDYGSVDAVVAGNFAKCKIEGTFYGEAANAIRFSPYKEADGGPAFENSIQDTDIKLDVHGAVGDFIKNTATSGAYVVRSSVSGSATSVATSRAVPANFISMTSLRVDLYERTQNSRISGCADQVSATLFSALPNKKIDLDIGRVGPLDIRGDLTTTSFAPSHFYRDQSASARDGKVMVDADAFTMYMERTQGSETFDPFLAYNAATSSGRVSSGTTVVFGWNAGYLFAPALGNYASDAAAAAASVPVGGIYRNAGVLQVRTA